MAKLILPEFDPQFELHKFIVIEDEGEVRLAWVGLKEWPGHHTWIVENIFQLNPGLRTVTLHGGGTLAITSEQEVGLGLMSGSYGYASLVEVLPLIEKLFPLTVSISVRARQAVDSLKEAGREWGPRGYPTR